MSGGADGAVRMWKVSDRQTPGGTHQWEQQWQLPQCCPCSVRSLAVAGCKQLLVGGADGGVRVWFFAPQVRLETFAQDALLHSNCVASYQLAPLLTAAGAEPRLDTEAHVE